MTLRLPDGLRRDVLLGPWNSPASRKEYARRVAEINVDPVAAIRDSKIDPITVAEVALAFLEWAAGYYGTSSELDTYKLVIRTLRADYGSAPAVEFGPLALKVVRLKMVEANLCRKEINRRVRMVVRIFRWAAGEEIIPAAVPVALKMVEGYRAGRSPTPDRPKKPLPSIADVRAVFPFVQPTVRAMIEVQLATGMRSGELILLRPADVDQSEQVWTFTPPTHKTAHLGKARTVALGPRAQAVLAAIEPTEPMNYYFNPRIAIETLNEAKRARRRTPLWPSHVEALRKKRRRNPKRTPAEFYTSHSYHRAVRRGIEQANARRAELAGEGNFDSLGWHPHQLRHLHATLVRKNFGLEAAQVTLGHSRADVTQIYAERDVGLAVEVAARLG
jgi:integrase